MPISIFGTFGVMYLLGYSLDILSLMALTIATGFVVDDAIVVMENISRHMEEGMPRTASGVPRRARSRLHRALDQPVADHGVPADPADGRHSRTAVPRVHRHAVDRDPGVAGDFAHHHADVVRAVSQDRAGARPGGPAEPVRAGADRLRPHADLGAAPQFAGAIDLHRHDRPEHVFVRRRARRAFFHNRTPAALSAHCRPTKAFRSRR